MEAVITRSNLVNHYSRVGYSFRIKVFLTHPRNLHPKAFVLSRGGLMCPWEFRFCSRDLKYISRGLSSCCEAPQNVTFTEEV
jgi:hypothetical protein